MKPWTDDGTAPWLSEAKGQNWLRNWWLRCQLNYCGQYCEPTGIRKSDIITGAPAWHPGAFRREVKGALGSDLEADCMCPHHQDGPD